MSRPQTSAVTITTDESGDATGYTSVHSGEIVSVHYVKDDFANGVDFTITTNTTGQNVWVESNVNASAVRAPRQPTHDSVGVASLYAAAGEPVEGPICMVDESLKIVVAQGGSAKSGTFRVIVR